MAPRTCPVPNRCPEHPGRAPRPGGVLLLLLLTLLALPGLSRVSAATGAGPPSMVLIVADDLGYGDLGCYGSRDHRTPQLDRLAAEGLRFTDFHSNGAMCTPTRAALLTGRYPQRFGPRFEGPLSGQEDFDTGLPLEAVTLAEALKQAGYATGMYGKWHLGYRPPYLPPRQGFDDFRGLTSGDGDHHTQIDRSGREDWWHGDRVATERGYTADLITRHSVRFIQRNRNRPFFLYVPHLAIHFPWQGPDDPPHRVPGRDYSDDKWGIIPDRNNVRPHVKAMVEALDASVGEIVGALRRLGLERRTLVLFTSDNGGYIHYGETHRNISSNGPLRGQKGQLFEGGHRVPAIAWWPGRITPGETAETAMTFDLFPTFLELAGRPVRPSATDGVSIVTLLTRGKSPAPRTLFWRSPGSWAARRGPWKAVASRVGTPMLFNLESDPGEQKDRAEERPEVLRDLTAALAEWEADVDHAAPAGRRRERR